jgi:ABC-type transport system involved in cytochrome bd biosynthesis fused ATPase/permease subunit
MRADQILVLDGGRVVQSGTHAELLAQDGFYRSIFHLQTQIEAEWDEPELLAGVVAGVAG